VLKLLLFSSFAQFSISVHRLHQSDIIPCCSEQICIALRRVARRAGTRDSVAKAH